MAERLRGLAMARKLTARAVAAAKPGRMIAVGLNPIDERRKAKAPPPGKPTFGDAATDLMAAKAHEWRNAKHRAQWRMTLETYGAPIWSLPVDEVDTAAVLTVLQPLWQTRPKPPKGFAAGSKLS